MNVKKTKTGKEVKASKEEYWERASCTSLCLYHVVFTPKFRRKVLVDKVAMMLKKLITEKQEEFGYVLHELNIEPDHVHIIMQCDPDKGVSSVVAKIKAYTAMVIRREIPKMRSQLPCLWTRAKFVASIGTVPMDVVKQYIKAQKNV